uniref:Glycosyltransferase n=1 Tax=viral metagenome TaxID=1070528 RepID=A0A6C0L6C9_9ZZZZ
MGQIPRITHQIWLQGWHELPAKFQENVRLLAEKNPRYTHMHWDEESLRRECALVGNAVLEKFDSFSHLIQKVDLGRFVILYNYGGISVDTDMKSLNSIDTTPYIDLADCMISKGAFPLNLTGRTNNAVILTRPRHPFLHDLILTITSSNLEEQYSTKEMCIYYTTGPHLFETVLERHRDEVVFLDNRFYEPCFSLDPMCNPKEDSIMDHQHEMSWISPIFMDMIRLLFPVAYIMSALSILVAVFYVVRFFTKKHLKVQRPVV